MKISWKVFLVVLLFWETTANAKLTAGPDICTITDANPADLKDAMNGYNDFRFDSRICKGRIIFEDDGKKLVIDAEIEISGTPAIKTKEGPDVGTRIEAGEGKRFTLDATKLGECPIKVKDGSLIDIIRIDLIVADPSRAICDFDRRPLYTLKGDRAEQTETQRNSIFIDPSVTIRGSGSLPTIPSPPPVGFVDPTCTLTKERVVDPATGRTVGFRLTWKTENTVSGLLCRQSYNKEVAACEVLKANEEGSTLINPSLITTYSLAAMGKDGKTFCHSPKVTVSPPPKCDLFEVRPSKTGEGYTLYWETRNADTSIRVMDDSIVYLKNPKLVGGGIPAYFGKLIYGGNNEVYTAVINPNGETEYTLTAKGTGGKCTAKATFRPSEIKCSLSKERDSVTKRYLLSWSVKGEGMTSGGASVTLIKGTEAIPATPAGSLLESPTKDTTYTLMATSRYGASCESEKVTLQADQDWDGIPDSVDKCRTLFGSLPDGCPDPTCTISSTRQGDHYLIEWDVKGELLKTVTLVTSEDKKAPQNTDLNPKSHAKGNLSVKPVTDTIYTIKGTTEGGKGCEKPTPIVRPIALAELDTDKDKIADAYDDCPETDKQTYKHVTSRGCIDDDQDNAPDICEGAKPEANCVKDKCLAAFGPPPDGCPLAQTVLSSTPKCEFSAASGKEKGSFDLTWKTTNAAIVEIAEGGKTISSEVNSKEALKVTPKGSTSYLLTAKATGDLYACSVEIILDPDKGVLSPIECSLQSKVAEKGSGYDLTWTTKGAASVKLSDGTEKPLSESMSGSQNVRPTNPTSYTLNAKTEGAGSCSERILLLPTSLPGSPSVSAPQCNVTRTKKEKEEGVFILTWEVKEAKTVEFIESVEGKKPEESKIDKVEAKGSREVKPASPTTYTVKGSKPDMQPCSQSFVLSPLSLKSENPRPPDAAAEEGCGCRIDGRSPGGPNEVLPFLWIGLTFIAMLILKRAHGGT